MTIRIAAALLLSLALSSPLLAARSAKEQALETINRQMWLPFVEGVRTDRAEMYVGVHAKDFFWVAPGSEGRIMDLEEYDLDSREVMAKRAKDGSTSDLEVRFLERNVDDGFAAEKCVIKFVIRREGTPDATYYSIAHFFSRLEDGTWKMWLQYGSREKADAALFDGAARLEDVGKFAPSPKKPSAG